jgi:hypothetical protein
MRQFRARNRYLDGNANLLGFSPASATKGSPVGNLTASWSSVINNANAKQILIFPNEYIGYGESRVPEKSMKSVNVASDSASSGTNFFSKTLEY